MLNCKTPDTLIKSLLEYPNETISVEYKGSFPWAFNIDDLQKNNKAQEVVASILGMSNVKDGGKIIIGIKQDSKTKALTVTGMVDDHFSTYIADNIYEMVRYFGEPQPRFQVEGFEWKDRKFVVLNVQSFELTPVVCRNKRGLNKIKTSAIYIRTHKPETKRIDKPEEMKDLVNLTVEKELETFSARVSKLFSNFSKDTSKTTMTPKPSDREKFVAELKEYLTND